uniref:Protein tyrosine phosphatase receptor type C n=1 Tax=Jaculus jaculus TaxID=51337 RepID=A0A8C5L925_JACJA
RTMYLWLKLLAFGFVILDTEVFVTGVTSTQTPHLPTHAGSQAPSGGRADTQTLNSKAVIAPTPAPGGLHPSDSTIPPTIRLASSTVTPPTTTIATTQPKPSCDDKYRNVTVDYLFDNNTKLFEAKLNDYLDSACKPEECKKLKECSMSNITLVDSSCTSNKTLALDVPPDPERFNLLDCTLKEIANISICLEWTVK